jgi:hypothetical protein
LFDDLIVRGVIVDGELSEAGERIPGIVAGIHGVSIKHNDSHRNSINSIEANLITARARFSRSMNRSEENGSGGRPSSARALHTQAHTAFFA